MIYIKLFWSFFQIGLFSIGGGYAAMPLIQEQAIEKHHWLTNAQFTDIITIAEMTPGPISINCATFVGTLTAGIPGAIIATIGCICPSVCIVTVLAYIYYQFRNLNIVQNILSMLRPAVIAMIACAGINILCTAIGITQDMQVYHICSISIPSCIIFIGALFLLLKYSIDPIKIMIGTGMVGLMVFTLF